MRRSEERIFDEFLAASARAGDRSSFERLAKRWQPKLLGHAYRLTGEAEFARDVVQDAWTDIARGLSRLDDAAAFPAWAYRIVSRRAADGIRKKQRERNKMNAIAAEPEKIDGQAAQMEFHADGGPLSKAMKTLSREQHAAIALYYREDFSVAEIAAALRVPAGTVKTRLMHARKKLRAALEGESKNGRS